MTVFIKVRIIATQISSKTITSDEKFSKAGTDKPKESSFVKPKPKINEYQLPKDNEEDRSKTQSKSSKPSTTNTKSKKQSSQNLRPKESQNSTLGTSVVPKVKDPESKVNTTKDIEVRALTENKTLLNQSQIKYTGGGVENHKNESKGLKIKQKDACKEDKSISGALNSSQNQSRDVSNQNNLKRKSGSEKIKQVLERHCSPLLSKEEKLEAKEYGYSFDSKKVKDAIGLLDIDILCQCIAHAMLKHIAFSKGEILIDDLVEDNEDLPHFSYEFEDHLRIDLDEIQRQKELKEWEAEARNMENYDRLQYLMHGGDPYMYSHDYQTHPEDYHFDPNFVYHDDVPEECDRINTEQIPVPEVSQFDDPRFLPKVEARNNTINISTGQPISDQNADIRMDQRPNSQVCNMPVLKMDEMLQDNGRTPAPNRRLMNSYYTNISMMGYSKPFFFPPPDLGMVESMGSFENTSRFFKSVKSSNMNRSFGKNASAIGTSIRSKNGTMFREAEIEVPLKTQEVKDLKNDADAGLQQQESKIDIVAPKPQDDLSVTSLDSIDSNFTDPDKYKSSVSEMAKAEEPQRIDAAINVVETEEVLTQEDAHDENPHNLSTESYYILEDLTREGLQKYLKNAMLVFNERYSIDSQ